MKRKVASRKLKRTCIYCDKSFVKGNVYYLKRVVHQLFDEITAYEYIACPRCKYEQRRKEKRFKKFVTSGKCKHPKIEEVWSPMAGESHLLEPSHDECLVCGEHVW